MSAPRVGVVVATHNRPGSLAALLDGLRAQTLAPHEFEVVIVDDGSEGATAALLRSEAERGQLALRVIRRARAGGPAAARDQGWRASQAQLIAFTDDDCVPEPGWLTAGLAAWDGERERFVQGWTGPPEGAVQALRGPAAAFTRTIRVQDLDPGFQTCNIFYPRELLARIGGFDTATFGRSPGGEDADLGWRAIAAGGSPSFCSEARVRHALNRLGPLGKLRVAARWVTPLRVYALHPELRRAHFTARIFWKRSHLLLARALLAASLPRRLRLLAPWLALPYVRDLLARGRVEGGGATALPYFVLHDLVEMATVIVAAIRYRTPML